MNSSANPAAATAAESGSRARMIEAAIGLMRGSGLSGAGINEIVRASGAPKGSVYYYFPGGKLQLVEAALAVYSPRVMAVIDAAMAGRRRPGTRVQALFAAFAARAEAGDFAQSCAVGTVSLDLDAELASLQHVLAAMLAEWRDCIARHFDHGDAAQARSFAGLLLTAIEGAWVRSRAERSAQPFVEAGKWLATLAENQFGATA